jgi:hypothetical protein
MKNKILLTLLPILLWAFTAASQPKLNSFPTASATIYLDFDGEEVTSAVWNNGNNISCTASGLNSTQITEIFNRVAEDYRPFNINITTDIDVFIAAPVDRRIRVIITPTSNWFPGVGGVAYAGAFTWGDDTPCFVFCDKLGPNNAKMVAECCSHESGHTLGLSHQSKYDGGCNLTATYNDGTGSGETGWAPIMGNSYYRNMSGWNNGPTPYGCSNMQDNLSIITSQNGFGYRADDYSDDINNAPSVIHSSNISIDGIISTSTDKDAFTFSLSQNSNFHLDAVPFGFTASNEGADLDIKLSLYDAAKNLVKVYNPSGSMSVAIDTILAAGTYYLVVDGTGNTNATDYGSLGSYTLKGLFGVLPVCNISLNAAASNNRHQFNWNIACNETISTVVLQSSTDGIHFTDVSSFGSRQTSFSYMPPQATDLYYRLQVIAVSGNTVYSGIIMLKKAMVAKQFIVSTFVTNDISVTAPGKYQYRISSINGDHIAAGNATGGTTKINIANQPAGIYILQLSGCGLKQSIRVLKQ